MPGCSRRAQSVDCLECAAPQSSAARGRGAEKPPLGRVARDGSVYRGMPSAARRGSLARLPKGKGQESPKRGFYPCSDPDPRQTLGRAALIFRTSVYRRGLLGAVPHNEEREHVVVCSPFHGGIGGRSCALRRDVESGRFAIDPCRERDRTLRAETISLGSGNESRPAGRRRLCLNTNKPESDSCVPP